MSVDSENPEDDLIFDDDEFLADEPDADKDKIAFGDAEGKGGDAPGGEDLDQVFDEDRPVPQAQSTGWDGDAENENLFADQSVEGEATETFTSGRAFSEDSGAGWGGQRTDPEEMGIPTDGDLDPLKSDSDQAFDLDAEDQELQLVEHESELDAFESDAIETPNAFAEEEQEDAAAEPHFLLDEQESDTVEAEFSSGEEEGATAETHYVLDEQEDAAAETEFSFGQEESDDAEMQYVLSDEEESDEWAPVAAEGELATEEESYVLADDQQEVYADEAQPESAAEGEPDYTEYEESYVEAHDDYETTEVGPRRRFRLVKLASGMAAACLIAAAGTVVVMKPELFGLKAKPESVDVVQVDRPQIDLTLAAPVLEPIVVTPDPVVPDPVVPDPVVPDPVTPDPVTPDPVVPDPVIPDPVVPDPVIPDPVTPDPVVATPDPTVGPDSGPIQLGETGIAIGEIDGGEVAVVKHPLTAGVVPGNQAFAQLKNGNFFIGKVKTVNAPINITLSVDKGEVTLALVELRMLASLGSDEYMELQRAEKGYVRLSNNNLLRGTILRYGRDDNVILEMKANQILIPKEEIEEMGNQTSDFSIRLDEATDNEWVRRLVEEQMVRESGPNPSRGDKERLQTLPVIPGVNRDR